MLVVSKWMVWAIGCRGVSVVSKWMVLGHRMSWCLSGVKVDGVGPWSCFPFIRSGQNHLARHSVRRKKTRRTKEEVGRQHQGMDRPGVRQVPEGSREQGKMEKTGCEIICGAPITLSVNDDDDNDDYIPTCSQTQTFDRVKRKRTVSFKAYTREG